MILRIARDPHRTEAFFVHRQNVENYVKQLWAGFIHASHIEFVARDTWFPGRQKADPGWQYVVHIYIEDYDLTRRRPVNSRNSEDPLNVLDRGRRFRTKKHR